MKYLLALTFVTITSTSSYSQNVNSKDSNNVTQVKTSSYAYITVQNKGLGKKLTVNVDLGDNPEQVKAGEEFSETLANKKSYAAILNYMAENHFELVESRELNYSLQGTGGSYGVVFIMRKAR